MLAHGHIYVANRLLTLRPRVNAILHLLEQAALRRYTAACWVCVWLCLAVLVLYTTDGNCHVPFGLRIWQSGSEYEKGN